MQQIWINLPVKNIEKSKEFFRQIGFKSNPRHEKAENVGSFLLGSSNFVMMLFPEETFKGFTHHEIANTANGNEILLNIDAQSKHEVDEMADKVRKAGGVIFSEPAESQGWMYGFGFLDPDGHRWNMLYMDMTKAPQEDVNAFSDLQSEAI